MAILFDGRPQAAIACTSDGGNAGNPVTTPPWKRVRNENCVLTDMVCIVNPTTVGIGARHPKVWRLTADTRGMDTTFRHRVEMWRGRQAAVDLGGSDTGELPGVTRWYGTSVYYPTGWSNIVAGWSYLWQFKDMTDSGSGPLWGLQRPGNKLQFRMDNYQATATILQQDFVDPVTLGHWYDIKIQIQYRDTATGFVKLWVKDWTAGDTQWTNVIDSSGNPHTTLRNPALSPTGNTDRAHYNGFYMGPLSGGDHQFRYYASGGVVATAEADINNIFGGGAALPAVNIQTTTLPDALTGSPYSQTLVATGGLAPYTWSRTAGTLPTGLTLSTGGVLSGTPTAAATYNFTVQAADSQGTPSTDTQALTVIVTSPVTPVAPEIVTTTLPDGQVGALYDETLVAQSGTPPYTWDITAGALPGGG